MGYVGNEPDANYTSFAQQTITGNGGTSYTLSHAVASGKEILLYINNVKQEEGSGKAYEATGTALTLSEAISSSDSCYCVFLGKALQTTVPPDGSVSAAKIASGAVTSAKLDTNIQADTLYNKTGDNDSGLDLSTNDVVAVKTANTERMRVDASGHFYIGKTTTTSADAGIFIQGNGGIDATRASSRVMLLNRLTDDGDILEFQRANAKAGGIGTLSGHFYIGDGDTAISPRDDLDSILPSNMSSYGGRDDAIDIGYSSVRFDDVYASNGTIQTSDKNLKEDIASLTSAEMKVGARLSKLFKTFRWKSKVAEKGDKARTHSGIIAQDVADAFTAEGLDATKYGLYGSNTWDVDKDGQDTVIANTSKVGEKTRLSIRYPELLCFVSAYNEQRFTDIETRLTALEGK